MTRIPSRQQPTPNPRSTPRPLEGQVAVVTGAGKGIGRATALCLARAGAAVVGAARTTADLDSLVAEVQALGQPALAVPTDVRERVQAERLIRVAADELGQIDILVNNAGTNFRAPIDRVTNEQWEEILGANLDGTFYCTRAVAPLMMARRSGKIINVSSLSGVRGTSTRTAYTAAKHGVVGFAKALALDLKDYGVTVSTVLPGPIATDLRARSVPDEDPGTLISPYQVAEVILFLATRPPEVIIPEVAIYPRVTI
jgi:3-oxoacyl-[acyl-carrier protein] reductase